MQKNSVVPISPVSKDLLYMKVADAIQSYITVNKLERGDKIPSERVLAEQFQTGRNSVREALRVLENEGLIEVKIGCGAFVTGKSGGSSIYLKLFKGNYLELLEVKMILERAVVARAAELATDEHISELERSMKLMESEAERGVYARDADHRFHQKLLSLSGNKSLEHMILDLVRVLDDYASMLEDADRFWLTTVPYHRQLLDSIKSHDPGAAMRAYGKIEEIDIATLHTVMDAEQTR